MILLQRPRGKKVKVMEVRRGVSPNWGRDGTSSEQLGAFVNHEDRAEGSVRLGTLLSLSAMQL